MKAFVGMLVAAVMLAASSLGGLVPCSGGALVVSAAAEAPAIPSMPGMPGTGSNEHGSRECPMPVMLSCCQSLASVALRLDECTSLAPDSRTRFPGAARLTSWTAAPDTPPPRA